MQGKNWLILIVVLVLLTIPIEIFIWALSSFDRTGIVSWTLHLGLTALYIYSIYKAITEW